MTERRAYPEPQGASAEARMRLPSPLPARVRAALGAAMARGWQSLRRSVDLFVPYHHPAAAMRERTDLIARRVRLIAGIFAVLTASTPPGPPK